MVATKLEILLLLTLHFVILLRFTASIVPQEEVEAVENILAAMNATNWRFDGDDCSLDMVSEVPRLSQEANASIGCDCNIGNDTDCHVVRITHKFYSLDRVLSPELVKLPYLRSIDFAYNYLSGTIPPEWGSTQLQEISLLGNRLTGSIPPELGNITTLTQLNLEANQLSGTVPSALGRLTNLDSLMLSSNMLTGRLPTTLGQLGNLTDLRISEVTGPAQAFPQLNNTHGLIRLILRNCNISGEIPDYMWQVRELELF